MGDRGETDVAECHMFVKDMFLCVVGPQTHTQCFTLQLCLRAAGCCCGVIIIKSRKTIQVKFERGKSNERKTEKTFNSSYFKTKKLN